MTENALQLGDIYLEGSKIVAWRAGVNIAIGCGARSCF